MTTLELSPYLLGPFAPVDSELDSELLEVDGELPADLSGTYVRNGPNPRFSPLGRYHWFDGDGMLHAVEFEGGRARYRNRWVRTAGLEAELARNEPLWSGVMEPVRRPAPPYKDTANTDVVFHGGRLLALWYISGQPYQIDPRTLATTGTYAGPMAAHPKVDPKTGELRFFSFGFRSPFMSYGVLDPNGAVVHHTGIELPGPRLPHDLAITENHSILMDLPVCFDEEALRARRWVTTFRRDLPARFGIIPRRGAGSEIRWFEAAPCYVYHSINAWEEGDRIVMIGFRVEDPLPAPDPRDGAWAKMLANLRVTARLHRWVFDLSTGLVSETPLDDKNAEFPSSDPRRRGQRSRYGYSVSLAPEPTLLFDGLIRHDLESGQRVEHHFGPGRYGSEAPFAPRAGALEEDDGYLLSFVHTLGEPRSVLEIYSARQLADGPIATVRLPVRVPLGFHATWIPSEVIQ